MDLFNRYLFFQYLFQSMIPSVALVITTYESSSYLLRTLLSALHQSAPFDEIIVIDDFSSDHPEYIIAEFNQAFNQKVLFYSLGSNFGGPAKSRNAALDCIDSHLVVYLDADDVLLPHRCLHVKLLYSTQPFDSSICRFQSFIHNDTTNMMFLGKQVPNYHGSQFLSLSTLLDFSLLTPGSSLCFKSSTIRNYLFCEDPEIIAGEDREILLRMSLDELCIIHSNTVDFLYNTGTSSSNLITSDAHITSPRRSLQIAIFLRSRYHDFLKPDQFLSIDFSYAVALFRLGKYLNLFSYLFSLPFPYLWLLIRLFFSRLIINLTAK